VRTLPQPPAPARRRQRPAVAGLQPARLGPHPRLLCRTVQPLRKPPLERPRSPSVPGTLLRRGISLSCAGAVFNSPATSSVSRSCLSGSPCALSSSGPLRSAMMLSRTGNGASRRPGSSAARDGEAGPRPVHGSTFTVHEQKNGASFCGKPHEVRLRQEQRGSSDLLDNSLRAAGKRPALVAAGRTRSRSAGRAARRCTRAAVFAPRAASLRLRAERPCGHAVASHGPTRMRGGGAGKLACRRS